MNWLCIDTGSYRSAYILMDDRKILSCGIHDNRNLIPVILELDLNYRVDAVCIEMITIYGGNRTSSQITEGIIMIGEIMGFLRTYSRPSVRPFYTHIPCYRLTRHQVLYHFFKKTKFPKGVSADREVQRLIRERYGLKIRKRSKDGVRRDIWQALAIYEMIRDCNFEPEWYDPFKKPLNVPHKKLSPEERTEQRKKFLERQIKKSQKQLAALQSVPSQPS